MLMELFVTAIRYMYVILKSDFRNRLKTNYHLHFLTFFIRNIIIEYIYCYSQTPTCSSNCLFDIKNMHSKTSYHFNLDSLMFKFFTAGCFLFHSNNILTKLIKYILYTCTASPVISYFDGDLTFLLSTFIYRPTGIIIIKNILLR